MQAIQVKYLPATDTQCSRVKAWSYSGKQVTLPWDDSIDNKNFTNAVMQLLKDLEWEGAWMGAQLPGQDYAFICINHKAPLMVGIE